jgi:hypothetical protein
MTGGVAAVTDWSDVLARDFALPAGRPLGELVDELVAMLAAADPAVRDDIAYPVLAVSTGRGVLDGQLARLGDLLSAHIGAGPVYQRSFAAMTLSWVILRDAMTHELTDDLVLRWLGTFGRWWLGETDLRGWDADLGWLHAVAHGADLLRAFGRSARLGGQQLCGLLELATERLLAKHGYLWADGEERGRERCTRTRARLGGEHVSHAWIRVRVRRPRRRLVRPGERRDGTGRFTAARQHREGRHRRYAAAAVARARLTTEPQPAYRSRTHST